MTKKEPRNVRAPSFAISTIRQWTQQCIVSIAVQFARHSILYINARALLGSLCDLWSLGSRGKKNSASLRNLRHRNSAKQRNLRHQHRSCVIFISSKKISGHVGFKLPPHSQCYSFAGKRTNHHATVALCNGYLVQLLPRAAVTLCNCYRAQLLHFATVTTGGSNEWLSTWLGSAWWEIHQMALQLPQLAVRAQHNSSSRVRRAWGATMSDNYCSRIYTS